MANQKISALTSYTNPDAANDVLPIVDTANTTTKKITRNNLLGLSSAPVGLTDSQTLTNKILTAPTLASPVLSGTITGTYTLAGTPTFPASVVTLTGSQTLTNKILTSPTISAPTITNASLTTDAITGFSSANTGTIYGVAVTSGLIAGSSVTNIPAASLGTSAITLGYAQITSNSTTTSTTATTPSVPLTVTVTIPSGGRRILITVYTAYLQASANNAQMTLWDGTIGSGTQLSLATSPGTATGGVATLIASTTPATGSKTYNVGLNIVTSGTATINAATTFPAFILVQAI